jgi:capsule polysaccharide export protein KpsE/RkpR
MERPIVEALAQRTLPEIEPDLETDSPQNGHGHLPRSEPPSMIQARLLWNSRRLLFRFAAWGVLASAIICLLIPNKYDSVTQLMPPDSGNSSSMMLAALAGKGSDTADMLGGYAGTLLGTKSSGAEFIGILQSRTVEDALVSKFDLRRVYWVNRWDDARKELQERTFIAEDRKSGIINIRVRDRRPDRAKAMAQEYVDQLNQAVNTLSTSSARREREFLETRLKAVKQELDQAATDFSQFASKNTAINIPEQGKAMVEAAARLQGELIAAEAQREGLAQIYTPQNPRVRAVEGKIEELRRQLNKLTAAGTGAGQSTEETELYPSIRQLPLLGVTYADLFRRTKIEEAVYERLTGEYEMAKVQEAKEIPTVKVLDPPDYPERKVTPRRSLWVGAGFLVSFFIGCIWILGKYKWEATDPSIPEKAFVQEVATHLKVNAQSLWRQLSRSATDSD